MTKVVLVTGCAGFIGSHVASALLRRGDVVIGVDEINDYYDIKNKERNLKEIQHNNFIFYKVNYSNKDAIQIIMDRHNVTHIAHLGARAGVRYSLENPYVYVESNVNGTMTLLDLAVKNKIQNFVLTSSSSIYGNSKKVPFIEKDPALDKPISPYAATKRATELMAYTYHHLYKLNINVVRPFTVYGPRGRPDMAPWIFVKAALEGTQIKKFGDGSSARDYTFIADFVQGFVAALDKPLGFEIFNLGNSQTVTLNEFIQTVEEVTGKKLNYKQIEMQPGDVDITYADTSKAKQMLGYAPHTTIKEGLTEFVKWYRETYNL